MTRAYLLLSFLLVGSASQALTSHFECQETGPAHVRPYYLKAINNGVAYQTYPGLGQNPMTSLTECQRAVQAANQAYGAVCSRTGLDGWKPTLYTGTVPGRPDFGYLGGSSILNFDDCLLATRKSSAKGICFWGGSEWYAGPIDREGILGGPYSSLDDCTEHTKE